jgi:DNA repair protein RecO (recombination protein O)
MLYKTKGIVLSSIKFKESSIIVKIYTEAFGIQSYIVNGVRTNKSKFNKIALFQPLTLLDMVVYHKPGTDTLQRLSEVKNSYPFKTLPFDMVKTSLALFMAELMGKCLREEEGNDRLFIFLEESVVGLDRAEAGLESYHLFFMARLAGYLGFGIDSPVEFLKGLREYRYPVAADSLSGPLSCLLKEDVTGLRQSGRAGRSELLSQLLYYYGVHLESFGEMRSLEVLRDVLR